MELTSRDIEIMNMIFKLRFLTTKQINKYYFLGKIKYGYKRIAKLKDNNYIKPKPLLSKGLKRSSCFFLTDKAVHCLLAHGFIDKLHRATTLDLEKWKLEYNVHVNDRLLELQFRYGWHVSSGIEIKRASNLDRQNTIYAVINSPSGKNLCLFTLGESPKAITVNKLRRNIQQLSSKYSSSAVYCFSSESSQRLLDDKKSFGAYELHVMDNPTTEELMIACDPHPLFEHLTNSYVLGEANPHYAHAVVQHKSAKMESFAVQLITNSRTARAFVKAFTFEEANRQEKAMHMLYRKGDSFVVDDEYLSGGQDQIMPIAVDINKNKDIISEAYKSYNKQESVYS